MAKRAALYVRVSTADRFRAGDRPGRARLGAEPGPSGRPNITGFINFEFSIGTKWLEALKQIAPRITRVALIYNPETAPYADLFQQPVEAAAAAFAVTPITVAALRCRARTRGRRLRAHAERRTVGAAGRHELDPS
jgi:hypothetical protein